jgi:pimeloyl-ACP methyl ester carboxylesterase
MRNTIFTLAAAAIAGAIGAAAAAALENGNGYAEVNGLKMYYEVSGEERPLVVLHGAYMSTESMKPLTAPLAEKRQVIAVDLQAHGRTADLDRPITYEQMADDVAALMEAIGIGEADVFGYSMGGGVALQLAIRHPERVRRLASAAAGYKTEAMYPELVQMIAGMTPETFAGSPWEAEYKKVAPNPDDFPKLVEKLIALDTTPMNWPADDIRGIKAPTIIISGDADVIRPEHSVEIYRLLGGGPSSDFMGTSTDELAILPATSHLGILEKSGLVAEIVLRFFEKEVKG